jgi:hypothetical protein
MLAITSELNLNKNADQKVLAILETSVSLKLP